MYALPVLFGGYLLTTQTIHLKDSDLVHSPGVRAEFALEGGLIRARERPGGDARRQENGRNPSSDEVYDSIAKSCCHNTFACGLPVKCVLWHPEISVLLLHDAR